jgi:hypothetical protein
VAWRSFQTLDNVLAQLCSLLPSVVRIPHCYGEGKDVIMITAQHVVNCYNQIVGQADILTCGDVLKDRLHSVPTFSEFSIHFYESSTAVCMTCNIYIYICECVCVCISRVSRHM